MPTLSLPMLPIPVLLLPGFRLPELKLPPFPLPTLPEPELSFPTFLSPWLRSPWLPLPACAQSHQTIGMQLYACMEASKESRQTIGKQLRALTAASKGMDASWKKKSSALCRCRMALHEHRGRNTAQTAMFQSAAALSMTVAPHACCSMALQLGMAHTVDQAQGHSPDKGEGSMHGGRPSAAITSAELC